VLDGIRALAVLIVVWFHFWQQSWLWGYTEKDALEGIGIMDANIDWLAVNGYVFVDMMILLSGFLLFLPHARQMVEGAKKPDIADFYTRRVARIFPSYYLCFVIFLIFFVKIGDYQNIFDYIVDCISNLTFTQMLSPATYLGSHFNRALWTVCVEMAFYVIFPLVAWFFKKAPIITYLAMCGCSWLYFVKIVVPSNNLSVVINQFPTFLCVYANGMMAAYIFVYLANNVKHNKISGIFFTGIAIFSLYFIRIMIKYDLHTTNNADKQMWQVQNRFALSLVFVMLIIGAAFSFKWFRWLFGNPVMRFLSAISFNLYIWHQTVAVKLKEWKIPFWDVAEGELPQAVMGTKWQVKYFFISLFVSIIIAVLITYLFEKPIDKLIMKGYKKLRSVITGKAS
jgi:peptidoglycan/LPS O-acetylase OafA/YrhL